MKWVTRPSVRLDRVACIWLIKRHIDPSAEILYRDPTDMVEAFAAGALPFHNTSAEDKDLAERTSFEMLAVEYGLDHRDPAIQQMAEIVRGAELSAVQAPPESAGLIAFVKGSKALTHSDEEMVAMTLPMFDALYAFCSSRVNGKSDWRSLESAAFSTPAQVRKI